MTKATETFTFLGVSCIIYFVLLLGVIPTPTIIKEEILTVFPWWVLVSFGAYSLGNIGYHVYKFRDCEEAYHELMEEINQAKDDLRTKGVTVD
ncbi:7198_t:CDS:2 [Ambispora leptoticha]|uniref:Dolichol-phosphate mannosyltransferase subunit 3 n=1 Tax=Ambispora leptoticha TaxID=144679 RepID=A0A9N8VWD0_9GLOM|nr:7198_t:CDS:2 [Ambispora leptoticha]